MIKKILIVSLFMQLAAYTIGLSAIERNQVSLQEIPHFEGGIVLNGDLSELVWQNALKIELAYETFPAENIPASQQTYAYLFEDGINLYVGFDAKDKDIDKIRAYLSPRDNILNSDYVSISLDTFNDSRKAYQFYTNAIGVQADSVIDEATNNNDLGWDAIWKSVGAVNQHGYVVEMKIPLKSLRFKNNTKIKQWKINLSRVWSRDVKHVFSNVKSARSS